MKWPTNRSQLTLQLLEAEIKVEAQEVLIFPLQLCRHISPSVPLQEMALYNSACCWLSSTTYAGAGWPEGGAGCPIHEVTDGVVPAAAPAPLTGLRDTGQPVLSGTAPVHLAHRPAPGPGPSDTGPLAPGLTATACQANIVAFLFIKIKYFYSPLEVSSIRRAKIVRRRENKIKMLIIILHQLDWSVNLSEKNNQLGSGTVTWDRVLDWRYYILSFRYILSHYQIKVQSKKGGVSTNNFDTNFSNMENAISSSLNCLPPDIINTFCHHEKHFLMTLSDLVTWYSSFSSQFPAAVKYFSEV